MSFFFSSQTFHATSIIYFSQVKSVFNLIKQNRQFLSCTALETTRQNIKTSIQYIVFATFFKLLSDKCHVTLVCTLIRWLTVHDLRFGNTAQFRTHDPYPHKDQFHHRLLVLPRTKEGLAPKFQNVTSLQWQ